MGLRLKRCQAPEGPQTAAMPIILFMKMLGPTQWRWLMRDKYAGIAAITLLAIVALLAQVDFAKEIVIMTVGIIAAFIRD